MPGDLNAINIARLHSGEFADDDTVTILFTGDCQRFYNKVEELVETANANNNIDFLLLAGDISDFSLLREFEWIYEWFEKLQTPYICVIGNHDLTANGSEIYSNMWGPKNFSFIYKGYKFVCHDNNSREYNFSGNIPDIPWLAGQLNDTKASWYVAASHIPPWDQDFDGKLKEPYLNLFGSTPGFLLSLHGHLVDSRSMYYNNDSVLYMNSSGVQRGEAIIIKLFKGSLFFETIKY